MAILEQIVIPRGTDRAAVLAWVDELNDRQVLEMFEDHQVLGYSAIVNNDEEHLLHVVDQAIVKAAKGEEA